MRRSGESARTAASRPCAGGAVAEDGAVVVSLLASPACASGVGGVHCSNRLDEGPAVQPWGHFHWILASAGGAAAPLATGARPRGTVVQAPRAQLRLAAGETAAIGRWPGCRRLMGPDDATAGGPLARSWGWLLVAPAACWWRGAAQACPTRTAPPTPPLGSSGRRGCFGCDCGCGAARGALCTEKRGRAATSSRACSWPPSGADGSAAVAISSTAAVAPTTCPGLGEGAPAATAAVATGCGEAGVVG